MCVRWRERDESPVIIIIIIIAAARPSYSFFSLEAVSGLNESIKRGVGKCVQCGERKRWKFIFISPWCFINKKIKKGRDAAADLTPKICITIRMNNLFTFSAITWRILLSPFIYGNSWEMHFALVLFTELRGRRERRSPGTYWPSIFICAENTEAGEPPDIQNVLSRFHTMCVT